MEGLDEMLTVHRLGVFHELGISLKTTNLIESMMARMEEKTARVDRWRTSDQKQRWCAGAMLEHERRFRRIKGYQHLPLLISDQTPWQHLEEQGVGWDLPLDNAAAFARRVEEVAAWSVQQRAECSARARALAAGVGNDQAPVEANRRLFLDAIESHQRARHAVI